MRQIPLVLLFLFFPACSREKPTPSAEAAPATEASVEAVAPTASSREAAASAAAPAGSAAPAERRGYGASEMSRPPCVKLEDNVLVGRNCPPGFVVFGPYTRTPAEANADFVFELEADDDIKVYADLVSDTATVFYGALPDQTVARGTTRRFSQRVHLFKEIEAFESRIAVRSERPVNFKIRDLVLSIQ
jgi:hypothetical protein